MKRTNLIKYASSLAIVAMVMSFAGCKDESYPVPEASSQAKFSYSVEIVEEGGTSFFRVQFTNQSVNALAYSWSFGNGATSTEENPLVIYNDQGDFNVVLTITPQNNDLYYNKTTYTQTLRLLLKETIFIEPFDGDGTEQWLPTGWLAVDSDGDTYNWYWGIRNGNGQMRSQSYASGAALTPDNWLITHEIDLTNIPANVDIRLSFNVCPSASTPTYRKEHYGVFIASPASTSPSAFSNNIWEETLQESFTNWVYQFREIDISAYRGNVIRIGFRHFNVTDMDRIIIDDIEVYKKF